MCLATYAEFPFVELVEALNVRSGSHDAHTEGYRHFSSTLYTTFYLDVQDTIPDYASHGYSGRLKVYGYILICQSSLPLCLLD